MFSLSPPLLPATCCFSAIKEACFLDYFMSMFVMPKSVVDKIHSLFSRFFWGFSIDKKKIPMVAGEVLRLPKEYGGVGCPDVRVKNYALLNKWFFKYVNDQQCLWSKVIEAKMGDNSNSILPFESNGRHASWGWKQIIHPPNSCENLISNLTSGLKIQIGDGLKANFWYDIWVGNLILSVKFPRIFALATKKSGKVAEFGHFENAEWKWNIELRRRVFDWEQAQYQSFLCLIDSVKLVEGRTDSIVWLGASDGNYTAKSFCDNYYATFHSKCSWAKGIWMGLAPPKIEIFVWQLLRERVLTRAELAKRNVIPWPEAFCAICGEGYETNSHLFLTCNFAWIVWQQIAGLWGVRLVLSNVLSAWFEIWEDSAPVTESKEIWRMAFFATAWSLWIHRNELVFKGKVADSKEAVEITKFRIACWSKAKWPGIALHMDQVAQWPNLVVPVKKVKRDTRWTPPTLSELSFNVDASLVIGSDIAGIGGILRDRNGTHLIIFSKSIRCLVPVAAELAAIREACLIFLASKWAGCKSVVIYSDCQVAINMLVDRVVTPANLNAAKEDILQLVRRQKMSFKHCSREANGEADHLAKEGVGRTMPLLEVVDGHSSLIV